MNTSGLWRLFLLSALPLFFAAEVHSQATSAAGVPPQISLLTFAPGEVYWQRFGHNALLVRESSGIERVYNYGMFDFQQKNFFLNFARGHMDYWLAEHSLDATVWSYAREDRWVYEQRLNLDDEQRRALADFLAWNARPENAGYRYDYFSDNCSTRVRDAIDRALGGALRRQLEDRATDRSYRIEALRLMSPQPALMLGMGALLGPIPDQPINLWQQSFVPMVLMDAVRGLRLRSATGEQRPLIAAEGWLRRADVPPAPERPPSFLGRFALAGLALAAGLLLLARRRVHAAARLGFAVLASTTALVCGLAGLVLAAGWGLTDHWAMGANQNLLLFSPLCLVLLPAWLRSVRRDWRPGRGTQIAATLVAGLGVLALLWKVSPLPHQSNASWIMLLLPVHFALAWVAIRARNIQA